MGRGGLDGGNDFLCDGQIHGRADGAVASGVADDHGYAWMLGKDLLRRFLIDNKIATGTDVVDDVLLLVMPVDADDEAEIDVGRGGGRDDVGGVGSRGS